MLGAFDRVMFASFWNNHAFRFQLFAEPGVAMEQHGTEARLDFGIFYLAMRETAGRHMYVLDRHDTYEGYHVRIDPIFVACHGCIL